MPEVDALFGVPQPEAHHPEIDTGVHTLSVLEQAALHKQPLTVRWACLLHDLGKGLTPEEEWLTAIHPDDVRMAREIHTSQKAGLSGDG